MVQKDGRLDVQGFSGFTQAGKKRWDGCGGGLGLLFRVRIVPLLAQTAVELIQVIQFWEVGDLISFPHPYGQKLSSQW